MINDLNLTKLFPLPLRLWDHIPTQHAGRPQWYVVHAWSGSLEDMVDALLEELTPVTTTPGAFTQPNLKASVMLWIGKDNILLRA